MAREGYFETLQRRPHCALLISERSVEAYLERSIHRVRVTSGAAEELQLRSSRVLPDRRESEAAAGALSRSTSHQRGDPPSCWGASQRDPSFARALVDPDDPGPLRTPHADDRQGRRGALRRDDGQMTQSHACSLPRLKVSRNGETAPSVKGQANRIGGPLALDDLSRSASGRTRRRLVSRSTGGQPRAIPAPYEAGACHYSWKR